MEDEEIVFVYGSLLHGIYNFPVIEPHIIESLGNGKIRGTLIDLGRYPALLLDDGGDVFGEWYKITPQGLRSLDQLEGYPMYYDRAKVSDLKRVLEGWTYHQTGRETRNFGVVKSGNWRKYFLDDASVR